MNSLQHIIDGHLSLLKERGYSEDALQAFPYPKSFADRMTEHFAVAVLNGLAKNEAHSFAVPLTGFFRDDKDAVSIDVGFRYNPNNGDFTMQKITGRLGQVRFERTLKNPVADLLKASELYYRLSVVSGPAVSADLKIDADTRERIFQAAILNRHVLEQAGIIPPIKNPYKPDWFLMGFEEKLFPLIKNPPSEPRPTFVLPFSRQLKNDIYRTDLRVLYQFSLQEPVIASLKGIHAKSTGARMMYLVGKGARIPSVNQIQNDLATEGVKKIAAFMHPVITSHRHRH